MSVLRVVEVERDPSREITRARLAAELEIFADDVALGDEFLVLDPAATVALLGAAARAFWAEEAIVHLDGWMTAGGGAAPQIGAGLARDPARPRRRMAAPRFASRGSMTRSLRI